MGGEAFGGDLVARAIGGDSVALKLLLTDLHPQLCGYVARKMPADLQRVLSVEDVVQEAEIEVFRRITTFVPQGPRAFERWATTIALSRLRNAIKWHRTLKRGGAVPAARATANVDDSTVALLDLLAAPANTPSRVVSKKEVAAAVQAAINDLPERHRRVVWLLHIEGQPVKRVAEELACSERAVHGLCRRGLRLLEERLRGFWDVANGTA